MTRIPPVRYWRYRFYYAGGKHTDFAIQAPTNLLARLNAREHAWFYFARREAIKTRVTVWRNFGEDTV